LDTKTPGVLANKLLAASSPADSEALKIHVTIVPVKQATVLFDVDDEVEQIYFPLSGMVSLLVILKNGNAVETATIGREGVVGAMAGLGLHRSRVRAVIQLAGTVARIPAPQFRKIIASARRYQIFAFDITRHCSHRHGSQPHVISRTQWRRAFADGCCKAATAQRATRYH
jgi:CRP-like cAMP-binding protein